ncbi:MAG: helix-turn-helix transcriptional regulator [Actinomycetota bacterium]
MSGRPAGLDDLDRIDAVFAALAHPARRQILTVLRVRGSMTSGELAGRFDHSWPTTSRHLKVLIDAGLVSAAQDGRERHYRVDVATLDAVAGSWIDRFRSGPPVTAR